MDFNGKFYLCTLICKSKCCVLSILKMHKVDVESPINIGYLKAIFSVYPRFQKQIQNFYE